MKMYKNNINFTADFTAHLPTHHSGHHFCILYLYSNLEPFHKGMIVLLIA